jgi:hypothetical protein
VCVCSYRRVREREREQEHRVEVKVEGEIARCAAQGPTAHGHRTQKIAAPGRGTRARALLASMACHTTHDTRHDTGSAPQRTTPMLMPARLIFFFPSHTATDTKNTMASANIRNSNQAVSGHV